MCGASIRAIVLGGLCIALAACQSQRPDSREAAQRGKAIADLWCSECHRVSPDQPSGARAGHLLAPPMVAPSFMTLAAAPHADRESLRRFVAELHLPMPTFRLSAQEQDEVITYILSLKSERAD